MREVIATGKTVEEATENGCAELGLSRDEVSVEILEFPVKKLFKNAPAKVRVTAEGEPESQKAAEEDVRPAAVQAPVPVPAPVSAPAQQAKSEEREAKPRERDKTKKPAPGQALPSEPEIPIDIATSPKVAQAVAYLESIIAATGAGAVDITAVQQGEATLLRVEGGQIADHIEVRGEVIQALSYLIDRAVNAGVEKREKEYLRIRLDVAGYRSRRENELIVLANSTGAEVARTGRSRTLAPMNPYERLIVHTAISAMEGVTSESVGADTERRVVIKSLGPNATDGDDWKPGRTGGSRGGGYAGRGGSGDRRDDRGQRRPGGGRGREHGGQGPRMQQSSTPEREYADKPRNPDAKPVVPEHREAIKDGEDLPLYGKIEL